MLMSALALATTSITLGACSVMPPTINQALAPEPQTFHFADGGQVLYYVLDKRLTPELPDDARLADDSLRHGDRLPVATFMFVVSGSGCTSLRYFLPQYFRGLDGESGPIRIFMLQKRFIGERTWGRTFGCDPAFIQADHPSQWIADQRAFIAAQRAALPADRRPARIVIVGISEGAEIAPLLARLTPGTTHVVLLGNGGMPPMETYRLQLLRHGLSMPIELAALPGPAWSMEPNPSRLIAGYTWRYWYELAQLAPAADLLDLPDETPIWVAMGTEDEAVPIASADYLAREFARHRRTNLVLKKYPGANHALVTNSRLNTDDFWFSFDRSMAESPFLAIPTLP